jgi:predicted secreted Zn-dependent protease
MSEQVTQVLDEEDQMAAALADLRTEKTDPTEEVAAPVAEAKSAPVEDEPAVSSNATEAQQPQTTEATKSDADELSKTREELHRLKSEMGRVNALNRLYNEARAKADALEQEVAQYRSKPQQAAPVEAVQGEAMSKLAEVAEKVKDFPELAGLVAAVGAALSSTESKAAEVAKQTAAQVVQPLEGLRAEAEQKRASAQRAAYEAAVGEFQSAYPSAVDVIRSDDFKHWMRSAPTAIQLAFQKSNDPKDAMTVMDAYDAHLRRAGKQAIAVTKPQGEQLDTKPAAPKATPNTQRLQAAAGLPSRNSGAKGGMPPEDDFDASLAFFRSQRLRRAAA